MILQSKTAIEILNSKKQISYFTTKNNSSTKKEKPKQQKTFLKYMKITKTTIEGVIIIEPRLFEDTRGYFFESFSQREFLTEVEDTRFVQDNESLSSYGVLRGLHFQKPPYAQAKLVRVVKGSILDVAVDIRKGSPTFGQYVSTELSDENKYQLYIPGGFAHGFVTLADDTIVQYKCDNYYYPETEGAILWNDPDLNIDWQIPHSEIILSEKDKKNPMLKDIVAL